MESAASRELLEETGYEAGKLEVIFEGVSSPGITDEIVTFMLATDLKKTGPGGGDKCEDIIVHEVAVDDLLDWLNGQIMQGKLVDLKVYSALPFCKSVDE